MIVLFNQTLLSTELSLPYNDRALQFGDGLFETIKVVDGVPLLLNFHLDRLWAGCDALNLNIPQYLSLEELKSDIQKVLLANELIDATIKLILWRGNTHQRAYFSQDTDANVMLQTRPISHGAVKQMVGFSKEVTLYPWKLSRYKTLSALPYVVASMERERLGYDDVIILDTLGHLSECSSSNLFWIANDIVYTPSLDTGCIEGVMRRRVIEHLGKLNISVETVRATPSVLHHAEAVFSTNSSGLHPIMEIEGIKKFE